MKLIHENDNIATFENEGYLIVVDKNLYNNGTELRERIGYFFFGTFPQDLQRGSYIHELIEKWYKSE